jgi:hypothetical protein
MDTMFFIIFSFFIFLSAVEAHISYQLINTLKLIVPINMKVHIININSVITRWCS